MKITPSMIDAGVAAMARIKKQHPVDSSVVATVFSAMYAALLRDEKRMAGTLVAEPYKHQDWPAWRYGPDGAGAVFARPEDVPEGWSEGPQSGISHVVERHIASQVVFTNEIVKRRGRPPKVKDDESKTMG